MFDDHRHAEPWTKRNERPGLDLVVWYKPKAIALRKCRNDKVRFNQRELITDALSRSCAEGQIRELRPICTLFWREAFGIERVGILPIGRKAMQDKRDDEGEPSTRETESAQLIVC
jgi:hypothetical protein